MPPSSLLERCDALNHVSSSPNLEELFELVAQLEAEGSEADARVARGYLEGMIPSVLPSDRSPISDEAPPLLFDCFMLFTELDLLELRLTELWDVVDSFVVVEATRTHAGAPKRLLFLDSRERFSRFEEKIVYVAVDDLPRGTASYVEKYQRNCILRGLTRARDKDLIAVSDVDELPSVEVLRRLKQEADPRPRNLVQRLSFFRMNYVVNYPWVGTTVCTQGALRAHFRGLPANLRRVSRAWGKVLEEVPDAGWHFSYLGSPEDIRYKIQSFSHQEYNDDQLNSIENIRAKVESRRHLFEVWKDDPLRRIPVGELDESNMPRSVVANLAYYVEKGFIE